MKIVRAIRQGRIVPNKPAATKPQFYALWSNADAERAPHAMHMPAPAPRLPDDSESYNPPAEHLLDPEERQAWEETEKGDRKKDYMPQKFNSLRLVPAYKELVQERFERCLDLYLAPRMRRTKLNIDPESLVPKMPSPKELRPFPTMSAIKYEHPGGARVRCISVDPTGMWVVSGAEDGTVRVWELANGRLAWKVEVAKGPVFSVEWCPDRDVALVAVTVYVPAPESGSPSRYLDLQLIIDLALPIDASSARTRPSSSPLFLFSTLTLPSTPPTPPSKPSLVLPPPPRPSHPTLPGSEEPKPSETEASSLSSTFPEPPSRSPGTGRETTLPPSLPMVRP
jgi:hypothetical protein